MKEDCIEQWFEMYERDITSFLIYLTGSRDVEDYVQETFLIAMKKCQDLKENPIQKHGSFPLPGIWSLTNIEETRFGIELNSM